MEDRQIWDIKYAEYLTSLDKVKPVIAAGDFNVAHKEIDLAYPESNRRSAGTQMKSVKALLIWEGLLIHFVIFMVMYRVYTWWAQRARTSKINNSGGELTLAGHDRIADK